MASVPRDDRADDASRWFVPCLVGWVLLLAAVYATVGVARHETFRSTGFDLGLFDQVVWHLGNGDEPASSLKDLPSIFGDHFSPVLLLFAPLGALEAGPVPLVIAQSVLVAASVGPVALFARPRLGDRGALAVAVAYGLFCGVQSAMAFDFHEVAVAPLLIAGRSCSPTGARGGGRWPACWRCCSSRRTCRSSSWPSGSGSPCSAAGGRRSCAVWPAWPGTPG